MALGIRGINPIWSEVDLQGKLFDDTFYMFVLQNTIPYAPATIYADPNLSQERSNPVRFFANGTLPSDIFYEEDKVYRLEFRQGDTQSAPLIYEVNDYVPGSGGSSPVDTVAFATTNQITNPQFSLISLENPVTISGTDPDPIELAPGWTLLLAGTGSITISRVSLNNSNSNPSNAPYALRLTMNGWTTDSVILRQRFQQNGMLWANKFVSTTVTARLQGNSQSITANLVDSNNSVLGNVLPVTPINETWNEYTGYAELLAATNPNTPPSAYIDYLLYLPSNIDIYLTSFQLVVQEVPIEPSFEQDSIDRQIDHTYNRAYPIVPVGCIIDFVGTVIPQHYYLCDGSTKNRVRDYLLFNVITFTQTITLTNGVATFTVPSNANFHIGMTLEGVGIPPGTTVGNIAGTTITMSANATATGPSLTRFFPWGNGDGSTTFNIPNFQGFTSAGANGQLFYTTTPGDLVNGIGMSGGESRHTLTIPEMPSHTHTLSTPIYNTSGSATHAVAPSQSNAGTEITLSMTGSGTPHNNVQPTILVNKCIRYQ